MQELTEAYNAAKAKPTKKNKKMELPVELPMLRKLLYDKISYLLLSMGKLCINVYAVSSYVIYSFSNLF